MEVSRLGVKSELQLPTYTTAHSNTRSLTHWSRPEIKPITSWFLVRFVFAVPWRELLFHSFLWLSNIPLHVCTASLSNPLLMDIQFVFTFWLLSTVPQWTLGCIYPFKLWFYLCICPGVGLLYHMIVLYLVFKETFTLSSTVVAPT